MQVLYLGSAPRTKESLPDFLKLRRVTRPPLVFRRLTSSQRTPGTGASHCVFRFLGFNSNLFNFRPPSPGKLNPNGRAGPKLDGINNSGLKCYWACNFFPFSFLRKTMD